MAGREGSAHYDFLTIERGLNDETLARFKVGTDGERITIPVRYGGRWRNVRRYKPRATKNKMLNLEGHGAALVYPVEVLQGNSMPVLLCEGEWDALLANQHADGRYVAVTGTGGASVPPRDLSPLAGREVFVAYDADKAGRDGGERIAAKLREAGATCRVLDLTRLGLTYSDKHGEDISDFFLRHGGTGQAIADEMARLRSAVRERFTFVSAADLAQPVPPMRWLVKGVWPERSYGVLAGEKKTLKTYTLLHMALAVASGGKMFDTFPAPVAGPVVYFLAEGGQGPTASRLQRIAATMDAPLAELPLFMAYDSAPTDSAEFRNAVQTALDTFQPALVIVDPLYAFHPADIEAQNLYARGQMLADLQTTVTADTALVVADHFKKTGGGELDLDSIAQSGMSQWADSWILQRHRQKPSVDAGAFALEVEMGSRQWGGRRWDVDWRLGHFDEELGEHVGDVGWEARPSASGTTEEAADPISLAILDRLEGTQQSKAAILDVPVSEGGIRGSSKVKRGVWDMLAAEGAIRPAGTGRGGQKWEVTPAAHRKTRLSGAGVDQ